MMQVTETPFRCGCGEFWMSKPAQDRDESCVKECSQMINVSKLHKQLLEEMSEREEEEASVRERKLHAV